MTGAPELYVNWINQHVGFNPRGQGHSDFLTARIVDDLRSRCSLIGEQFYTGALRLHANVGANGKRHMSPLVELDAEAGDEQEIDPNIDGVILRTSDAATMTTPLVIENKTIMTAHGKARTNRYNDARAYASHVHNTRPNTITAFTIVIVADHDNLPVRG